MLPSKRLGDASELLEWIELIPNKKIINIELENELCEKYNKLTKLNYIISFDFEFFRYNVSYKQIQTIREFGGILFYKENKKWFLHCIFHLNLKPLITNINQYYYIKSTYCSVSDLTLKKLLKNEKELLPEYKINNINYKEIIKSNQLIKIYMKSSLNELEYEPVKKKINKLSFFIKGYDLIKYPKEYNLFKTNIHLILNDKDVKNREIDDSKKFIYLTNKIFSLSYLIVKGEEDIKSLKNHSILLKENYNQVLKYFDIAQHNKILFDKCDSAELEKTYICLQKMNLTQKYNKYSDIINKFTKMKAHNPLTDAYYTWVIFNIFQLKKV